MSVDKLCHWGYCLLPLDGVWWYRAKHKLEGGRQREGGGETTGWHGIQEVRILNFLILLLSADSFTCIVDFNKKHFYDEVGSDTCTLPTKI